MSRYSADELQMLVALLSRLDGCGVCDTTLDRVLRELKTAALEASERPGLPQDYRLIFRDGRVLEAPSGKGIATLRDLRALNDRQSR